MLFVALAVDYDGTIAQHGRVDGRTVEALERARASGKRLFLVTGRQMSEIEDLFEPISLFDAIVAENGAVLHLPARREMRALCGAPPPELVDRLHAEGVNPMWVGSCIVATWEPNEEKVLKVVHELGLEWYIVFNKGAVMCVPAGISKASGLRAALSEFELSPFNVIGVGDGENDHAFLSICGYSVAVANAIDALKAKVDVIMQGDHGRAVIDLVQDWLERPDVLEAPRMSVELGRDEAGAPVLLYPSAGIVIAGASGGGKSTLATALIERIGERAQQFLIVDPEGDYADLEGAAHLGLPDRPPTLEEALALLDKPDDNLVLNLLGVDVPDRQPFGAALLGRLALLRSEKARPHWLFLDEAHHFFPAKSDASTLVIPAQAPGVVLITVDPGALACAALQIVRTLIAVGPEASDILRAFCTALSIPVPELPRNPEEGEVLLWHRASGSAPKFVRVTPPYRVHKRHTRKYAEGRLSEARSFFFRGPDARLNLRASNLTTFLELAAGVDAQTWMHHLARGDYSRWFRDVIGDRELADEARAVEVSARSEQDAEATKRAMREAVLRRYTAPAVGR
jgi:hydroxymethylpyrimidine pyrophosphatase-like HAD family hydrolase